MLLSKCAVCDSNISKIIKQQEVSGLLSSSGVKAFFFKIFRGISKSMQDIK